MGNSIDLLQARNAEALGGVIAAVAKNVPELNYFEASSIKKTLYNTLCVDGLPNVGFRAPNTLRTFDHPTVSLRPVECKYLDASWVLDDAIASGAEDEKQIFAIETEAHLLAALKKLASQIWYGTNSDANGFTGLRTLAQFGATGSKAVTISKGATAAATSVYVVSTGVRSVQIAWGNDGKWAASPINQYPVTGTSVATGAYYWSQKIAGYAGLQVTNPAAVGAITNIGTVATGASANVLTYADLVDVVNRFPGEFRPTAIFMSARSRQQLWNSMASGLLTTMPTPREFEGIPIYVTDAIRNDEETMSLAYSAAPENKKQKDA
jgi:hypothetical protein